MLKALRTVFLTVVVTILVVNSKILDKKNVSYEKEQARTFYTMEYSSVSGNDMNINVKNRIPLAEVEVMESSYDPEPDKPVDGLLSDVTVDGQRFLPITKRDLSAQSVFALSNGTSFEPDMVSLSNITPPALSDIKETDGPLVLIIHTHAGECYTEYDGVYPEGENTRSTDENKNVVRVGSEIAKTLSDFGIGCIHVKTRHDEESFINAYSESAKTVKKYLSEYPSIKFVVDVHRDAIIRDDGESIKVVKNIAGEDYAQLMFVVGTNELGHNHSDWQDNLSLAVNLQKTIDSSYPGLCRSINLRDVPFNQQLSKGYLLLEVGTSANTLDEALLSARAFGENLARIIYTNGN